jgi:hypothetical protein
MYGILKIQDTLIPLEGRSKNPLESFGITANNYHSFEGPVVDETNLRLMSLESDYLSKNTPKLKGK